jgi:FkbM family methyltransferase
MIDDLINLLKLNAAYDRETVDVMSAVLHQDSNCVDVGAHKGSVLRHMLKIAPVGTHHAFKALPHMAKELVAKFPLVQVHQVAVSDRSGQSEFQYVENAPAYSGLRRRIYDIADPKVNTIQVETTTLDEALPSDHPIKFMKLDIEGGEYHALKGAVNTVRRWRLLIVFEAGWKSTGQYGVTSDDLFMLIAEEFGYNLSTMRRWLNNEPAYSQEEFRRNWNHGPDFYFCATPKKGTP